MDIFTLGDVIKFFLTESNKFPLAEGGGWGGGGEKSII